MAKLLYVEPRDEITDLIDRIRRAEGERDLVFVVPPEGHVLRSPLDMRLLMQYTRGFQKRIAVVSGDPQIQALAMRTGFPTFPSLARLEQGAPLRGIPTPAPAAPEEEPAPVRSQPARPTSLAKRGPSQLVATGGGAAAGWLESLRNWWREHRRHNATLIAGAGIFLVGLLLVLFVLPGATVTLGVKAHRINDTVTIQGTLGSNRGTLDQIPTQALQSTTLSQSFTITPSGTQQLAPVPATGTLEFCGQSTRLPAPYTLTFTGSPSFVDTSSSGGSVVFTTTSTSSSGSYTVPQCPSTVGIPVQAVSSTTVGTQGNVAANQSWSWSGGGGQVDGLLPASNVNWTLANPQAMSGGVNATTQSVFTTSDASTAQSQMQTVDTALTQKAEAQLRSSAGKLVVAQDPAGNGIAVTVNNPTLPTGCNTSASTPCKAGSSQTLAVTVSAAATAYSPEVAKAAVLKDLRSRVPTDAALLDDPDIGNPKVVAAGPGGTVTLSAKAVGYWAAKLDLKPLQAKVVFMNPGAARSYLLSQLPGASTVKIQQFPFGLPWLPLFSGRIHLVRVSLTQGRNSA